jgi:hypothetical protein
MTELQLTLKNVVEEIPVATYGHSNAVIPWYHDVERIMGGERGV